MDDIRYAELQFLLTLEKGSLEYFSCHDEKQIKRVGLQPIRYVEMVAMLIEESYVNFDNEGLKLLVAHLRKELNSELCPPSVDRNYWYNPREGIQRALSGGISQRLRITYRGLRYIGELRDLLRRDRILEPFGILLSSQYFRRDFADALQRGPDISVSVIYADMDNFKQINTNFGHKAGDNVMKAYLEVVRDCLGDFGAGYRGVGDEVIGLIVGQEHEKAIKLAEQIRLGVESLRLEHNGKKLPQVTSSIGVATTPPADRTVDIETLAESRQDQAKSSGKNRVVAA